MNLGCNSLQTLNGDTQSMQMDVNAGNPPALELKTFELPLSRYGIPDYNFRAARTKCERYEKPALQRRKDGVRIKPSL